MNTKLLTSAGCLLLLAAAMAPAVLGHDERGTFGTANGVSGRYVGSAGPAIVDEDLGPTPLTQYGDTISAGAILCDVEVDGDGTAPFPQDEQTVDGYVNPLNPLVIPDDLLSGDPNELNNQAPDTNDDGGQGGACHTRNYLFSAYNTPGCPAATAHAANALGDVFLGAACDWKTIEGGTPQSDILLLCIVNSVLQGQPLNIVQCILSFVACLGNPTGCTTDGTEACGSDGSADGINYGYGSAPYPTVYADQGSVALDLDANQDGTVDGSCAQTDATAQVFVFDSVNVGVDPQVVIPALTGEVWQGTGAYEPLPQCATATEDDGGSDGGGFLTNPRDPQCSSISDDTE